MRKLSTMKRIMALLLVMTMTIGLMPVYTTAAEEMSPLTVSDKVADPETLNNWKDYYGTNSLLPDGSRGISTWKAGGVWTDKSVFSTNQELADAGFPSGVTLDDENDFIVSLSALGSNQEVVGHSSTPTDTMLVLDLSNSMDNSGSVPDMVEAANESIAALMDMNANSRVGVVLYSGNTNTSEDAKPSSATVILPLDRYTTTSTSTRWEWQDNRLVQVTRAQYLRVDGDNDTTVSVASGTRNSDGDRPRGSKNTNGGTYIQNGLYKAYQEFTATADKGVVQSGAQAGVQRTPILILMSDGAPTIATTDYYEVENSNTGNGSSVTNRITFLTQLTAAWVKGEISAYYNGTDAKFYTMGLGTANSEDATAVLNPSSTTNFTLLSYWSNYNHGDTDGEDVTIIQGSSGGRPGQSSSSWELTYKSVVESVGRNYVDRYWAADDAADMVGIFQQIVDEIALQSAYSATLVESGDADMDGYVTIQDELGSMMRIKDVKGIVIGDRLFTGAELAKSMNEGLLGQSSNPKDYGTQFVNTIKKRFGIDDTSVVQDLIRNAYHAGQLNYVSDSEYSNYIGWYGDANNAYIGFWQESYSDDMSYAPDGAEYINRCYIYLGETAHGTSASDMMHVVVQIRTEISTKHQRMAFRVPSSLIPMVTYSVDLTGDSIETAEEISLTVTEADPIRLLYEVGLPVDVNNVNIEQKVAEYLANGGNHMHKDSEGKYVFYANSWGSVHEQAPDIASMTDAEKAALTEIVAESHFIPNTANERFYILEDTPIYTRSGNSYVQVTSQPVAGTEYYFARTIITIVNGEAQATKQYEMLYPSTVAESSNFQKNAEGYWEVKGGTPRQTLSLLGLAKEENATDTIANSDHLWVYISGDEAADHHVYSFLGNNGKLKVAPATGLKVTKTVAELADGAAADEKFPILVTIDGIVDDPAVTDAEGNVLTDYTVAQSGGKTVVTVQLANGESAYVTGLTAGTTYTVTEAENDRYSYTYTGATETVHQTIVEGVVTNQPIKPGAMYITKEVVHAHTGESFPLDQEFAFQVTFKDKNGDPIANTYFEMENNYEPETVGRTTDENGVMPGWLRHGETVYIKGIPAGAVVTVEEIDIPENYTVTGYSSIDHSGDTADADGQVTIQSQQNATVVVTNTYTPKSTTVDIDIAGTKIFDVQGSPEAQQAGSFTFLAERWDGANWVEIANKTITLDYEAGAGSSTREFTIENVLEGVTFDRAGVYTYQVREKVGTVPNVTYDRTLYTFTVTVSDVNGQLVATVTDKNNQPIEDGSYETTFTNDYHSVAVSIDAYKSVVDTSGNPLTSPAGFKFLAQEAEITPEGQWVVKDGGATNEIFTDGAGEARFTATYKEAGNHYFIISERNEGKPGWDYTQQQYQVEIVITEDPVTEDLYANIIINGQDQQTDSGVITFTNTYDPEDAELALDTLVKKALAGRKLAKGEFTFAIFEDGKAVIENGVVTNLDAAIAVGSNDTEGKVLFTPQKLTYSQIGRHSYDVVEVKGSLGGVTYDPIVYDLVVEITDAGDGTLKASYYYEDSTEKTVVFNNTYTAAPTEVVIEGLKVVEIISGWKGFNVGDYTFGLYATDAEGQATGEALQTATNVANGTFRFAPIAYTLADAGKTYTYVVKEIAPDGTTDGSYSANGMTYSGSAYPVSVTVIDNGDGTLSTNVNGNGTDTIEFVNNYESNPASVTLGITKTMQGRTLTDGEFQFALYSSDATFVTRRLLRNDIVHDAQGAASVSLTGLDMGYHYYVLKEVIPEDRAAGIFYDASEYYITVQVVDAGKGQMNALVTIKHSGAPNANVTDINFRNIYVPEDTEITLSGTKTLTGGLPMADGMFSIGLYDANQTLVGTAAVKADGSFAFEPIVYTSESLDQSYTYTVSEIIPDGALDNGDGTWTLGTITYDPAEYEVTVNVTDTDKDGYLETAVTIDGSTAGSLAFTNIHTPEPITYVLEATKTYDKGLKGGDFEFQLISADDKTDVNQTKENDADGNIVFDPVSFTEAGTYTFTVKEKKEGILSFIRPSEAEYEVTITVANEDGVLRVTGVSSVNTKNTGEVDLEFINNYILDGEDAVIISGNKVLTGDRTQVNAGEFTFGLYDENGALIESVTNDANGDFTFSALVFDENDITMNGEAEFTYTVKEIAGDNARYTYDTAIYTVSVIVQDNDEGGVEATYTVAKDDEAAQIAFTNTYTDPTPVTYTPQAQKSYNKLMSGGEFTFQLEGQIAGTDIEQTKTNDADGLVIFDTLSFPEAGTYTFTVKEVNKILGFINYSTAEYEIEVNVIDTKGVLSIDSVTINDDPNGTLTFTNVYTFEGEGEVSLSGTKTLTGDRTQVNAGEFTFGLYDENGALIESVTNDANGNFRFTTLKYDQDDISIDGEKEFTYTVKEIAGDNARYTYDTAEYTVKVLVEDNNEGGITVSHTITKDDEAAQIAFTNTYTDPTPVTYTPQAQKSYNKLMSGGEFTFQLEGQIAGTDIEQTKTNDADGLVIFDTLSFPEAGTYTFTVKEVNKILGFINYSTAEYEIEVNVIDTKGVLSIGSVTINDDPNGTLTFTNVYTFEGEGEVSLSGTKTLTGDRTQVNAGEFTFGLYDENGALIESVTNDANGNFRFTTLAYDESHTAIDGNAEYVYTVKEIAGTNAGMTYDDTVYTVTVLVEDNNEGGITVRHTITEDGEAAQIAFNNTYTITGTGELELEGTKELTGGLQLTDGMFYFGLYENGEHIQTAMNTGDSFTFNREYDRTQLGEYVYTIAELIPDGAVENSDGTYTLDNVTFDPAVYTVNVSVLDNGEGGIRVEHTLVDAEEISFRNVYTPEPVKVHIDIEKLIDNKTEKEISLKGFEFALSFDGQSHKAVSDEDGHAGFTVTFDESHIGKTFEFKVKEKNTGIKGMTYDKTVHTIEVEVLQAEDGRLLTMINGEATDRILVEFTNLYEELVVPPLGDQFRVFLPITLMLLSIAGVATVIGIRKKKTA